MLLQKVLRKRFPQLTKDAHNDATQFAFGVIGFVYAILLGFVTSALWTQISGQDEQVRAEGTAGIQLARDRTVFGSADSDRIRVALLNYERAALTEWSTAAAGRTNPEADNAMHDLYAAYQQVQPGTDTQRAFLSTSFANLDKLSQARTGRVMQAQTDAGPPASLWAVILLTSALVVGCAITYGVAEPRTHYVMVATIGLLVAANLFLILELSYPYVGEIATSPQPLRDIVAVLSGAA